MIAMPMCEKDVRERDAFCAQSIGEGLDPEGKSLASVDEYSAGACADDEGVGTLELKLYIQGSSVYSRNLGKVFRGNLPFLDSHQEPESLCCSLSQRWVAREASIAE